MSVDEASQAGLTSLSALYLSDKVIVVGDDQQVSPMAVGMDLDRVQALADTYIKGILSNSWSLYTGTTSLYDIVMTICQPLMLREHFRCVPDIIEYSNGLCYEHKIRPLRDASSSLLPAVVNYRVDGTRVGKPNEVEADTIVALLQAMLELPDYEGKTFGVISLLGGEQADLVNNKILASFEASEIENRMLLCGDATSFQGDERDVILLSMVDSNQKKNPLPLRQPKTGDNYKRYNVAVSRARDQSWIIHSLDPKSDLKEKDIRKSLLDYADNIHSLKRKAEQIARESESPFEVAVANDLARKGYTFVQQWPVGSYRLDMVVMDGNKKVALECDGERFHSAAEDVRRDMERQTILERMGWNFIRLCGSEYYANPSMAMERVAHDLGKLGIFPSAEQQEQVDDTELLAEVKRKAQQYLVEKEKKGKLSDSTPIQPVLEGL